MHRHTHRRRRHGVVVVGGCGVGSRQLGSGLSLIMPACPFLTDHPNQNNPSV